MHGVYILIVSLTVSVPLEFTQKAMLKQNHFEESLVHLRIQYRLVITINYERSFAIMNVRV